MLRPVVKWAGGKRQILPHLSKHLPDQWDHYYEPFVGGGALLIHLYNQHLLNHATISDTNGELVDLYRVIRDNPEELVKVLNHGPFRNTPKDYLELRQRFNRLKRYRGCSIDKAALFLYLNRHGYNGLWRVNRNGEFNVPFGRYHSPALPSPEHIRAFSLMLKEVVIRKGDFASTTKKARAGDFVYFDPPYQPVSRTANFTSYVAGGFGYDEQVRLVRICTELRNRGVAVMVSNSFTPEILSLYREFSINRVIAHRAINSKPDARSGIIELIITSYP